VKPLDLAPLRASGISLALLCPGSVRVPVLALNETNEAAGAGSAAHEALRSLAETGRLDWDTIPAIAARYGVGVDEVRMLAALGAKLWPSVKASFPDALTEVDLSAQIAPGVVLTGHADILSITGTVARGGDWKTGRKDGDYSGQMRAYGALVLLENTELTEVTITVLWVRSAEIENYTMTRPEALSWVRGLIERVVNWDGVYRPGPHCHHCPRSHECEAANALVRRDIAAVADKSLVARAECELERMPPEEIVEILQKADTVMRYADRLREAIKRHVEKHGDIVANGVRLTIDVEPRRSVDPVAAWPVLEALGFADDDFAACMKLSISKLEDRVAKKAGKGKGAAAVRDLKANLDAHGAISVTELHKLTAKRA
jgi:hypothetical protein